MSERTISFAQAMERYVGQPIVLDTAEQIIYLGTLREVNEAGFWLENADVHDCRDGHATKELYVYEALTQGIRTNRRSVFVQRNAVMSLSALKDVVGDDLP
ncbi:MAG: hypothetical protein HJJLKODD_01237 [Phycisphaerae bacterium]|nr:hypothetical protein [Phycisphaerae bacterium]